MISYWVPIVTISICKNHSYYCINKYVLHVCRKKYCLALSLQSFPYDFAYKYGFLNWNRRVYVSRSVVEPRQTQPYAYCRHVEEKKIPEDKIFNVITKKRKTQLYFPHLINLKTTSHKNVQDFFKMTRKKIA